MIAGVNLDDRPLDKRFPAAVLTQLRGGETRVITDAGDRVEAVLRLDPEEEVYLYTSRKVNPAAIQQIEEARSAASDYQKTLLTSRTLPFRFNAVLSSEERRVGKEVVSTGSFRWAPDHEK